jgi:hypothetical protein
MADPAQGDNHPVYLARDQGVILENNRPCVS